MNNWQSEAIVINARKVSENDAILEVFSKLHGRVSAYVYGGASKRKRALMQLGQILNLEWRTKTEGALGYFDRMEAIGSVATIFDDNMALCALNSLCALLHEAIPENMAYTALFDASVLLLNALNYDDNWPSAYIAWEMGLLAHTGFGIDLSECALTGTLENLAWISPKTGRAANYEAGLAFKDKLLVLPPFLRSSSEEIKSGDIADGFALTGWFLEREVLRQSFKELPEARARLIYALGKAGKL